MRIKKTWENPWGGDTLHPVDFICCELAFKFCDLESADFCDLEFWPFIGVIIWYVRALESIQNPFICAPVIVWGCFKSFLPILDFLDFCSPVHALQTYRFFFNFLGFCLIFQDLKKNSLKSWDQKMGGFGHFSHTSCGPIGPILYTFVHPPGWTKV